MRASDRRQEILKAALSVFSRKGFGGATTKEIAAAAGVTEAIIFRHFPSKQVLYTAVLDRRMQAPDVQEWLDRTRGFMQRNDDAGLFRALVEGVLKSYRENLEYARLLLFAALEGHEQGLAHNRQVSEPVGGELIEYLARRQREGALRGFNPVLIVSALAGASEFYAVQTLMFGFDTGNLSDETVVETLTRIILQGVQLSVGKESENPA